MKIERVRSADGTSIAYETSGQGPPLILIGGAFCDRKARASGTPLAGLLADRFRVFSYDRRGRGDSEDAPSWSIDRELADLAALIAAAGGSASLFGNSSGALLALDAAARGFSIPRVVAFEPPVLLDDAWASSFDVLALQIDEAVAGGRRAEAVELFHTKAMQMPPEVVARMGRSPALEKLAHTLGSNLRITARGPARLDEMKAVRAATLFVAGGASPAWMREAIGKLASATPAARLLTLEGQTHDVDPAELARAVAAFLGA